MTPRALDPTDSRDLRRFRRIVLDHHAEQGRDHPWRHTRDPYRILVSEFMLQQTQVSRVLGRYERFLERFPDVQALADAPLEDVLRAWQGLGYNRRALSLKRLADTVVAEMGGIVPRDLAALRRLPGIGPATAASVAAFSFGDAHPYIETNIRAVFLHHFFPDDDAISDRDILPLVDLTLDRDDPRTWYYALMDYGAMLKRTHPNPSRRSRHHARQTRFEGSRRQLRALALRCVLDAPGVGVPDVKTALDGAGLLDSVDPADTEDPRAPADPTNPVSPDIAFGEREIAEVLEELVREGFLVHRGRGYAPAG